MTIDKKDYCISSYTKAGIKEISDVDTSIQNEVIEETKEIAETSDKFNLLLPLTGMSKAGIYLFYFRENKYN